MKDYEFDNSGKIHTTDLVRVFKRVGVLHPEPHMKHLIVAGGAKESDDTIDIILFSQQLQKNIDKELKIGMKKATEFIMKLNSLIQAKKLSIFEFFCILDVNLNGGLSKVEFKTGI